MRKLNLLAILLITSSTLSLTAVAGNNFSDKEKNICDRLIEQEGSKKDVEICFKEFGKSKYRKAVEKAASERGERIASNATEAAAQRAEQEAERKKYIIKRFEGKELKYLDFAYYVAIKYTDESMGRDETVDDKMTSPKELCAQLGFENAVSDSQGIGYTLSERVSDYSNPNFKGIYINWNARKKEVKWDDSDPASIKYYKSIVCKRLRETSEEAQSQDLQDAIRMVSEVQERETVESNGEEQVDTGRNEEPTEAELLVRRLLEERRSGTGNSDRFTHKSKTK